MTQNTDPRQLGDATVLRTRVGLSYTETLTIHQARGDRLRFNIDTSQAAARTSTSVTELPELIRTLIARSGRTDLELVVTEPAPDVEATETEETR